MPDFIDTSQYHKWNFCRWAWYEQYVLKRCKAWPQALRDDALAIGSLFHAGVEGWYARRDTTIPDDIVGKINPTPETLRMCRALVAGYVETYPREQWELIRCEQPIRFPLISGVDGLAKIDMYFYVPEATRVESGVQGYEITLSPGWWIQEYKTKSPYVKFDDFMQSWQTQIQADFQMLALQNIVGSAEHKEAFRYSLNFEPRTTVNGLLINICEKPKDYIPKRKCKTCDEYYIFAAWVPEGDSYKCPYGHVQKLKPLEERPPVEGNYFRIVVERTAEQLLQSKDYIREVAIKMSEMAADGRGKREGTEEFNIFPQNICAEFGPNKDHCFNLGAAYAKECEYFRPHLYGESTVGNVQYEDTEDYIGEPI